MNLDRKTKVSLGFCITVIGAAFWWAATTTTRLEHVRDDVKPIPQMQQDIATIKAIITSNPIAQE